ncbi:MAG TPA: inositol-3-phosphate synthase, partial [Thermodesulfobacteriota bacterium]|nr:inositol-3-phosphate synthase [Thermodesulfobacteriota bacterium]
MGKIRVAVAGVGNCASALLQGIEFYRETPAATDVEIVPGLMNRDIGGYLPGDIEVVAAFDIDRRKVGRPVTEAIFAPPNCTKRFVERMPAGGPVVGMGPVMDGVAPHMADYPDDRTFLPSSERPCDVDRVLRDSGAEILVNYLPVGSEAATRFYAEACLRTGVSLVNCIPVFIASDPEWADRFRKAGDAVLVATVSF